jgi:hypothetical protein
MNRDHIVCISKNFPIQKFNFCTLSSVQNEPGFVWMVVETSLVESAGMDFPLSPSWQV